MRRMWIRATDAKIVEERYGYTFDGAIRAGESDAEIAHDWNIFEKSGVTARGRINKVERRRTTLRSTVCRDRRRTVVKLEAQQSANRFPRSRLNSSSSTPTTSKIWVHPIGRHGTMNPAIRSRSAGISLRTRSNGGLLVGIWNGEVYAEYTT